MKDAYTQSRKLYENWISSWYGALQQILNNIPKLKQLSTNQKVSKQTLETVKKILLEAHRHQWALDRNKCSDGKLRTYVKTVYGRENYLSLMFLLNKNRISSHHFHIESGRYIRVHLWSQGYVSSAAQVKFEDEMHFLMFCSKYDKTRQDLFRIVGMTCINFQNLSIEEIFLWLMTCENDLVLKKMCQFICKYCR